MLRTVEYVIGVVVGIVYGSLVAFLNSRLTKRYLDRQQTGSNTGMASVLSLSLGRQLISLAALLVVFLLRNWLPWPFAAVLIGAAVGLSVISIVIIYRLTKKYEEK